MLRVFAIAVFTITLLVPSLSRASEMSLNFRPPSGGIWHYVVRSQIETKSPGFQLSITSTTLYAFQCDGRTSPFEVRGRILREKMHLTMTIPMVGKLEGKIDTAGDKPQPPENPMDFKKAIPYGLHVGYAARVGKPFTVVIEGNGAITRLKGVRALQDKATSALDDDPAINPMMSQGLKRDMTVETFQQGIEGVFLVLPEKPLAPGGRWSREYEQPQRDKSVLKLRETCTLTEADAAGAAFTAVTTLVKEGQSIDPEVQIPMQKLVSATAERYRVDTEGMIDTATGMPVFAVSIFEYKAKLELENAFNQKITKNDQTWKGEVSVEFSIEEPALD